MGLFGSLIKLTLDVIETPIAVVKDVATLGGSLTDQDLPYTVKKVKDIGKDFDKIKDEAEKL